MNPTLEHLHIQEVQLSYKSKVKASLRPKPGHALTMGKDELVPISMFSSGCVAIPIKQLEEAVSLLSAPLEGVDPEYGVKWCEDPRWGGFWSFWRPMVVESWPGKYEYLSEDFSAASRLAVAGCNSLAWTKPLLKHWGEQGYTYPAGHTIDVESAQRKP